MKQEQQRRVAEGNKQMMQEQLVHEVNPSPLPLSPLPFFDISSSYPANLVQTCICTPHMHTHSHVHIPRAHTHSHMHIPHAHTHSHMHTPHCTHTHSHMHPPHGTHTHSHMYIPPPPIHRWGSVRQQRRWTRSGSVVWTRQSTSQRKRPSGE